MRRRAHGYFLKLKKNRSIWRSSSADMITSMIYIKDNPDDSPISMVPWTIRREYPPRRLLLGAIGLPLSYVRDRPEEPCAIRRDNPSACNSVTGTRSLLFEVRKCSERQLLQAHARIISDDGYQSNRSSLRLGLAQSANELHTHNHNAITNA